MSGRAGALVLVALAWASYAAEGDPRGWTLGGTPAKGAAEITSTAAPVEIAVPSALTAHIRGPTVLFYFSPRCPHCRNVAREVQTLHNRLRTSTVGSVVGVASGSARRADVEEFSTTFAISFPVVMDQDREIATALALRSTPAAVLVERKNRVTVRVLDTWRPYAPGFDALIEGRLAGDPFAALAGSDGTRYLGHAACGACHTQEHASWRLTHHAVAWRTLELRHETGNAECVGCHVTGSAAPHLVDVGCEACHGPGGPHDGVPTVPESTCAACHDAKHSIAFSYEKGLPLLDHFAVVGLTPEQVTERRRALYNGEAPRALLALPEGRNVGSAACQSCHAEQHAWWAGDAHARAMDSLRKEGHDDPECVRCHATAVRSGPVPASLDSYQILDGVGCESCHGPGEAHVAAEGGTDNIEGLGDDCPVCVIEALCTTCHTPRWDPDWKLERALSRIRHGSP